MIPIEINIYKNDDFVEVKIRPDRRILIRKVSTEIATRSSTYHILSKRLLDSEKLSEKMVEDAKIEGNIIKSTKDNKHHILYTSIRMTEEAITAIYKSVKKLEEL